MSILRPLSRTARGICNRQIPWSPLLRHSRLDTTGVQHAHITRSVTGRRLNTDIRSKGDPRAGRSVNSAHSSSDDAFYDDYLHYQVRPFKWNPPIWIAQHASLPNELQKDPLLVLDNPESDLEIVGRCLEHFIATRNVPGDSQSKAAERRQYETIKPGHRALSWLLANEGHERFDLTLHPSFLRAVVHCLVAENGTEHLFDWIRVHHVPKFAASWQGLQQGHWKGAVARYMLVSITYWASTFSEGLQEALQKYETLLQIARSLQKAHGQPVITIAPAGTWLESQLCFSNELPDSRAFNDFIASLQIWSMDEESRRFAVAKLLLNHPTDPDPRPFYDILRDMDQPDSLQSRLTRFVLRKDNVRASSGLFIAIMKLVQHMKSKDVEKAKWALDFGRRRLPERFAQRGIKTRDDKPRVPFVMRAARGGEVESRNLQVAQAINQYRDVKYAPVPVRKCVSMRNRDPVEKHQV